jgi:hypothetical protein
MHAKTNDLIVADSKHRSFIPAKDSTDEGITFSIASAAASNSSLSRARSASIVGGWGGGGTPHFFLLHLPGSQTHSL